MHLLAEAGYADGFETTIYYRDVFRDYLPEPGLVAQDLQAQLKDNLNIDAEIVVMESGEFIDESTNGRLDGLYMLGWSADYLHITNFLDFHFGRSNPQFGEPHPEVYEILEEASQIADEATTAPLYAEANNNLKALVPMVPMAHGAPADAALADVEGAHTAVLGPPRLWRFVPGDRDTLVYLKAAEPISLYCMDETDGESLDACTMVTEGLYMYDEFGAAQPTLATALRRERGRHRLDLLPAGGRQVPRWLDARRQRCGPVAGSGDECRQPLPHRQHGCLRVSVLPVRRSDEPRRVDVQSTALGSKTY